MIGVVIDLAKNKALLKANVMVFVVVVHVTSSVKHIYALRNHFYYVTLVT